MEVWRKETCFVVNSPAGTNSQSLSGFFDGVGYPIGRTEGLNTLEARFACDNFSFFGIFRYFLRVNWLCFSHCSMGDAGND